MFLLSITEKIRLFIQKEILDHFSSDLGAGLIIIGCILLTICAIAPIFILSSMVISYATIVFVFMSCVIAVLTSSIIFLLCSER